MSELRKGQTVRVTYEAEWLLEYAGKGEPRGLVKVGRADFGVPNDATIEPIEDLRPGDVYRDVVGDVLLYAPRENEPEPRDPKSWILIHRGDSDAHAFCRTPGLRFFDHGDVRRPLSLLLRDGQPVTP